MDSVALYSGNALYYKVFAVALDYVPSVCIVQVFMLLCPLPVYYSHAQRALILSRTVQYFL